MFDFGLTGKTYVSDYVLKAMEKKVEFFLNSKLEPMLRIHEDRHRQEWHVESRRVLDLLTVIFYEVTLGDLLKKREKELFLAQIREKCRQGEMRFTQSEAEEAEENPIVLAVLQFMNGREQFEGRTVELLEMLRETPCANNKSKRDEISEFTNIFGKRLKRLIPVLAGYGVEVSLEHRESGSHCTLIRSESFEAEPEPITETVEKPDSSSPAVSEPSGVSSSDDMDLQPPNGSDSKNGFDFQASDSDPDTRPDSTGSKPPGEPYDWLRLM